MDMRPVLILMLYGVAISVAIGIGEIITYNVLVWAEIAYLFGTFMLPAVQKPWVMPRVEASLKSSLSYSLY